MKAVDDIADSLSRQLSRAKSSPIAAAARQQKPPKALRTQAGFTIQNGLAPLPACQSGVCRSWGRFPTTRLS